MEIADKEIIVLVISKDPITVPELPTLAILWSNI